MIEITVYVISIIISLSMIIGVCYHEKKRSIESFDKLIDDIKRKR